MVGVAVYFLCACASSGDHSFHPEKGMVPDKAAAIKIAEAVWTPIYGAEEISRQKPFFVTHEKNIWYVTGSLPKRSDGLAAIGGTAEIEIAQVDGKILRVSHSE